MKTAIGEEGYPGPTGSSGFKIKLVSSGGQGGVSLTGLN